MNQLDNHTAHDHADNHEENLHRFLGMIKARLEEDAAVTGMDQSLLSLGIMGEMAKKVEKFMIDPLMALYSSRNTVDDAMNDMLDNLVVDYLVARKELVSSAVRSDIGSLHYCVSLNEDTLDNRIDILRFVSDYKDLEFAPKYPIVMQFVPAHLMGKIRSKSTII